VQATAVDINWPRPNITGPRTKIAAVRTIHCDMILTILMCTQKMTGSQLSLPHAARNKNENLSDHGFTIRAGRYGQMIDYFRYRIVDLLFTLCMLVSLSLYACVRVCVCVCVQLLLLVIQPCCSSSMFHAHVSLYLYLLSEINNNNNKATLSNLGRGPRHGAVVHVRRKIPIG